MSSRLPTLLLAGALLLVGAPARADDPIGLSFDGQHWSDQLRRPLFDTEHRWVPGDAEVRSFFVRDAAATDARMTIQLVVPDGEQLMSLGGVVLAAREHGGRWHDLDPVGDGTAVLRAPLESGVPVRVDVRARLRSAAKNDSQASRLPLDLVVTLTQSGAGHTDGFIPGTGNAVESWLVLGAGLLVGGGIAVLVVRKRREQADG
ncbi:MAG TPA: LPXTG cell wall anchor domain-containing protein [Nocardioides sp.]|nr:LPXTG cell wall anchor domain-containing protein [Nocardioides sp.]